MSDTGIVYPAPALLTNISRLDNLLTQAAIEESDNTSRVRVSMPRDFRCSILDELRAVA